MGWQCKMLLVLYSSFRVSSLFRATFSSLGGRHTHGVVLTLKRRAAPLLPGAVGPVLDLPARLGHLGRLGRLGPPQPRRRHRATPVSMPAESARRRRREGGVPGVRRAGGEGVGKG